jgi:hypothetical protein
MARLNLPKTINVLGREYVIRRKRMRDYGCCDIGPGIIWIRSGLSHEDFHATLMHEVIHGILHESGVHYQFTDELTESIVRAIEHGMWRAGYRLETN